jgi:hypothetical protein
MRYVCGMFGELYTAGHMRSLEAAWNGIGGWLA